MPAEVLRFIPAAERRRARTRAEIERRLSAPHPVTVALAEREALLAKLDDFGWNVSRVARELAVPRIVLYSRLRYLGIQRPEGEGDGQKQGRQNKR